ncbi:MAG: ABC transporter ATP-binding protein [Oscillospiraceae bacterium]|nr:ABC transporter ATP-binding protein [Oscillospiraceae bacterium]
MTNVLEIKGLMKNFGEVKVIQGLDFVVPENCIFGFVGVNGAGKTTTMNMALGLLEIGEGEIFVCGEKVEYGKTVKCVGYLPDVPEYYTYMTPREYLMLCGEISGMSKDKIKARSKELLKLVGLSKVNRKIGGFSRGMKQRLGIAQALLNEPKLLICDEPTSALDPKGRKEILDILASLKGQTTVIFSTHILSDVERICDRVVFLHGGKVVLDGALSDLKLKHKSKSITIEFDEEIDSDEFLRVLSDNNITPSRVETGEACLESLFLEVIKK